ncbi:LysE family translocator [Aquabacterium sp.]|uniref:LysE family translocator n=1 Tax=Aquabacterium sp. TaxID=1872578 RepID=UPI0037849A2B
MFVAAAAVLLAIPGPTILTVISYSASHGRRATAPLIAGVALGDSTALLLSLLGLGALLSASALWFNVIKWAGGLYLLYLGIKMLRSGISGPAARRMLESPRTQRRFNLMGGSLICAAGAWALLAKRQGQ